MKTYIDRLYEDLRKGGEGDWHIHWVIKQWNEQPPLVPTDLPFVQEEPLSFYEFTITRTLDLGSDIFTSECLVGFHELPYEREYNNIVTRVLKASHPDNLGYYWPLVSRTIEPKAQWEQPLPEPGGAEVTPYAREEFLRCLLLQEAKGLEKYGTSLQTKNGRDPIQDAKAELIDAWQYLCQIELERKDK